MKSITITTVIDHYKTPVSMMMRMMAKTSHLLEVAEPVVMANITISVEEDVRIA
jgi:hypothetical protein